MARGFQYGTLVLLLVPWGLVVGTGFWIHRSGRRRDPDDPLG